MSKHLNELTETPLDDYLEELEGSIHTLLEDGSSEEEDTLSLVFAREEAAALAEFLSFMAMTYGHLPMVAEQIILAVGDWERELDGGE